MVRTVVLVGLLALVAGCDSSGDAPVSQPPATAKASAPSEAPATDPLGQVRAAATKTAGVPAHVNLSVPNVEVGGDVDPPGRALTLTVTTNADGEKVDSQVRVIGDDAWMTLGKTNLPNLDPTKFIRFPAAEFARASMVHLGDPFDPAGIKGLSATMTDAKRTGEGAYTGTLELAEAPAGVSRGLLPATAESLGDNGGVSQSVPYKASVDAQGYLTSLTVTLPTYASTARFSGFGKPVTVAKPTAAEVVEVPDGMRRLLAGTYN